GGDQAPERLGHGPGRELRLLPSSLRRGDQRLLAPLDGAALARLDEPVDQGSDPGVVSGPALQSKLLAQDVLQMAVGELLEPGMRHPEALVERPFRAGPVPLVPPPGTVLAESQDAVERS